MLLETLNPRFLSIYFITWLFSCKRPGVKAWKQVSWFRAICHISHFLLDWLSGLLKANSLLFVLHVNFIRRIFSQQCTVMTIWPHTEWFISILRELRIPLEQVLSDWLSVFPLTYGLAANNENGSSLKVSKSFCEDQTVTAMWCFTLFECELSLLSRSPNRE